MLISQRTLGMQDVLPAFSLDLHPAFFLSFSGATPLHVPCGKSGVVIFTAEKPSKAVEGDMEEKGEWNPLDRCVHSVLKGHSIGAVVGIERNWEKLHWAGNLNYFSQEVALFQPCDSVLAKARGQSSD